MRIGVRDVMVSLNDPMDLAMVSLSPAANVNGPPPGIAPRTGSFGWPPGAPVEAWRFPYIEAKWFQMPPDADAALGGMMSSGGRSPKG